MKRMNNTSKTLALVAVIAIAAGLLVATVGPTQALAHHRSSSQRSSAEIEQSTHQSSVVVGGTNTNSGNNAAANTNTGSATSFNIK